MALGTLHMTGGVGGNLTVDIPLLWGQKVNDYFRYDLTLASFFIDRSEELSDGGSDVYTPNIVALSTNAKTNGSQVTLNQPMQTKNTLTVSTWKESSFVIEDREMAQLKKSYYLQDKFAKSSAYDVAQDLEDAIAAQFTNFTVAGNIVGTAGANVADSSLLAAIAVLETAGVPGINSGDVAWIFHPNSFYRQIGSVDKLTLWQNTQTELPRAKAPTRSLYGIPVIVTPAVPLGAGAVGENSARLNLLAHKDAIHWARMTLPVKATSGYVGTEGVRIQQSYVQEYLGELVSVDLCYGTMLNRLDAVVKIRSHSVAVGL
jgi:hypothetical protein